MIMGGTSRARLPFPELDAVLHPSHHPAIRRLADDRRPRPLVAAHRGDSCRHAENTIGAFSAATSLGVALQEFDVRQLRDGELVCVHDATFDRTTDAAQVFGPGRLVRDCGLEDVRLLTCAGGERVPTLTEALDVMLPKTLPLIEHKAGEAQTYVDVILGAGLEDQVILQSFDWRFLEEARRLEPRLALGALGPNRCHPHPDDDALELLASFGAALVHWDATVLRRQDVERAHTAGLLVCTYTTDDELGWLGGRAMGVDVMCSNDPARMTAVIQGG